MTLKLNGSSSGYTAIDAPAAAGSNTLTLPANNGSNGQFLQTNGSGVLSFAAAGGGKVLQYVYETANTDVTTSGGSVSEVIDATITPASASNKILVLGFIVVDIAKTTNAYGVALLYRGASEGTLIMEAGTGSQADMAVTSCMTPWVIDSPNTTSAQEYTMSIKRGSGGTNNVSTSDSCNYHLLLAELEG